MTYENEEVCYINYPKKKPLEIEGVYLTAQNIWKNKDYWIQKVFEYYRQKGFPYPFMSIGEIKREFDLLCLKDSLDVYKEGEIKNSNTLGLDICKYINNNCYWECAGSKTPSILDAFNKDDTLMKVLKNRMGYEYSKSDWKEKGKWYKEGAHYLFDMSDDMLLQGFRSTMQGFSTSNFKPLVAKFLIERYCEGKNVLDPSIGWSARYLASRSLDKNYYGIDPSLSSSNTKVLAEILNDKKSIFVKSGSENEEAYLSFPIVDYVIVCPPYLDLEIYKGEGQSVSLYQTYEDWLKFYWVPTSKNCIDKLRKEGKFTLIMIDSYKDKDLLKDMSDILKNLGLKELERIPYKTSRSHLTKKAGNTKNTEICITFEKV